MQIIFSNSQKSLVRKISSRNLWKGLQSLEVKDLKIIDGMGEKQVYRSGNLKIYAEVDCFSLCDLVRLALTDYHDYPMNAHVMKDGSGDFYGCICNS